MIGNLDLMQKSRSMNQFKNNLFVLDLAVFIKDIIGHTHFKLSIRSKS
uniref:Uncharacterized protein n=1 Tax=Arundo donax TaxID=35708 RepID=A0A0A9HJL3_ARUDO